MAVTEKTLIMDAEAIRMKIRRLAYQVYENNFGEKELIVCGIEEEGYRLATMIYDELTKISEFSLSLRRLNMDKKNPEKGGNIEPPPASLKDSVVILCDDVLYTGRVMSYATIPFLQACPKKLQCLALIHRNHLNFPVQPTYTGMQLATTLQEHVLVDFDKLTVTLA